MDMFSFNWFPEPSPRRLLSVVCGGTEWAVRSFRAALVLLSLLVVVPTCSRADEEYFEQHVRPLLVQRCYGCHSGTRTSGGLSLESARGWQRGGENGPAIVPGRPEQSLLIDAVRYRTLQMPPPDAGGPLSAAEIEVLTTWIAQGAADPRQEIRTLGGMTPEQARTWWSFQPLPEASGTPSPADIDRRLEGAIAAQGLTLNEPADKRTLLRRVTYDLTGLPPTPDEVDAYLADDSPTAYAAVIDRLLASPQYGAHWGRHWLDVVRYADTAGENTDRPLPHAWRYRNWVLDSLNADLPFDEFARLQIAGDILTANADSNQRAAGLVATGYLAIGRRFGHDIDKELHLLHEDVIDNLGKNFLGLSLGCARCHDHKYDPISAADYYALYGVLDSTRFAFPGCEAKGQPRDLSPLLPAAEVAALTTEYQARLAAYEQPTQAASAESQRLQPLAAESTRVLFESAVGEGQSVALPTGESSPLDRIALRRGEALQLVVRPNDNHGADSTQVELEIHRRSEPEASWNVADLIPQFTAGGPAMADRGATWCLLDVAAGPVLLHEKQEQINAQPGLSGWSIGDTPSSFVNASAEPVAVWTTLPGRSYFLHPGHQRNVALTWVCPQDGEYQIAGRVADAHPAGLDGVSFRVEHVASPDYGDGLLCLGALATAPRPSKPDPPAIPVAYAVTEAEPKHARLQQRGDPGQLSEVIPRRWLTVFGGEPLAIDGGSGRRELAERIVQHPLFARVLVNRVWQWHFGRGLVATPNDFGSRGESPTHPELLDWLAAEFRANGYRLKPLQRLILQTAAYQRSSRTDPAALERDSDNRWLSRFARRRLTAEELRDSLLAVGGGLDLSFGQAHPFPPEAEWRYTQHDPFTAVYDTNRRSLFLMAQRQRRHPYLALFDGADPNSSTAARQSTTVATQALYFLNDPFFHAQAAACAAQIERQSDDAARLTLLVRRLYQRDPIPAEIELARRFTAEYPGDAHSQWSAVARVLLAANEFLYVD